MKITIEFDSLEEMLNFQKIRLGDQQSAIDNISLSDLLPDHIEGCKRAKTWLTNNSICTVADLVGHTERELLEIPNFGTKALYVTVKRLAEQGLKLKA